METVWLKEALFAGQTGNAFKLGTVLSLGWFWMRASGCTILCRGGPDVVISAETVDFDNALAVADADAGQISPPIYLRHDSEAAYFYVVRRVNGCGKEEHTLGCAASVAIDAGGDLKQPRPNCIFEMAAWQAAGSRIRLLWYYCPLEQRCRPERFKAYYDGGTGQIDYENPFAVINYAGLRFYSCQTGALGPGRYLFAIRTECAGGTEDESLARLSIQLDNVSPAAIDILDARQV